MHESTSRGRDGSEGAGGGYDGGRLSGASVCVGGGGSGEISN